MIKNIFSLAIQGMRRRKRQSLLIFFVLLISFAFAIMLLSYSSSIASTNSQLYSDTFGTWYASFIAEDEATDKEYLESNDWLEDIGVSITYGTLSEYNEYYEFYGIKNDSLNFGTIDDSLEDMGIQIQSGRMPKNSGEIAIESSVLSRLGFGSNLNQKVSLVVTFTVDDEEYEVVKEFTLVGIISSYTSVWNVSGALNNAIVTEDCIKELWDEATSRLYEAYQESLEIPTDITVFFTAKDGMDKNVQSNVNSYLSANHTSTANRKLSVNTAVELDEENAEVNTFYVWLILAVTLLAVVIIYVLQMQVEVRRIVRMRSLGGSKGQLRLLIFVETMILCLPAMILGACLGSLGLWGLLRISTYTGSTSIIISIPWNYLLISAGIWIAGVLVIRMITFQIALATPLTGRMVMQRGKTRVYQKFRQALVMLMSILLCVSVVFTSFNLAGPLYNYNDWSSRWVYYLWASSDFNYAVETPVTDELIATITNVEGISGVTGIETFVACVTFDDCEPVYLELCVLDSDELANLVDLSSVDTAAYDNGESVIIQYSDNDYSVEYYSPNITTSSIVEAGLSDSLEIGSNVTISIRYGSNITGVPSLDDVNGDDVISLDVAIGNVEIVDDSYGLRNLNDDFKRGSATNVYTSFEYVLAKYDYSVILCSRAFVERLIEQIPDNYFWYPSVTSYRLRKGDSMEYTSAYIYCNAGANFYATDAAMTNIAHDNVGLSLVNRREYITSNTQVYLQSIITLLVSGICIAAVVLLILLTTLRLEAESERRHYGILQALGMSRRQRNLEIMRKSAVRGIVSVAASVVCYLAYYLIINASMLADGTSPITVIETLFESLAVYRLTTPMIAIILLALFLVIFLICLISKLGLNKLHIMDMLNTES
ncbi:MAG: ABC transporter permease [Oscillospiraceae bacterium]|nr:ABC transporter permease [Oscillospiraceae bacterium]